MVFQTENSWPLQAYIKTWLPVMWFQASTMMSLRSSLFWDLTSIQWCHTVAYPGFFFGGWGVQQIQLRTEGRQNGDLGAVAPS
jgi:hypothetical protein